MTDTGAVNSTSGFDQTLANLGIGRTGTSSGTTQMLPVGYQQTLGQSDFLKLMTEQLNNQDPFNPMDNTQMVAQMAQFSSVAGISEMNSTLKDVATRLDAANAAQAIGYVGKTVLLEGDTAFPKTDGTLDAVLPLSDNADDVQVTISDQNGNLLRTLDLGAQNKGNVDINWDGKTDSGVSAGDGPFKIAASVVQSGITQAGTVQVWAPVTSVSLPSDGSAPLLNVAGLGQKPLTDVRQVG